MAHQSKKEIRSTAIGQVKLAEAKEISSGKASDISWPTLLQMLVIAVAVLWIYWPVLHGDWLWDDDIDISNNPITQSPTGLWKIWFAPGSQNDYYPIKASVQWLQWHLWHNDTLGYHLTNAGLHLFSALLVWRLFHKLGIHFAWLGGLIFAIHPAQVESVAWISELKNTLSLPPLLLAMIAYINYDERRQKLDYVLAVLFFLAAVFSKSSVVMFPVVILLYAWWKRRRIGWNDCKACSSFFVISLLLGLLTTYLQPYAIGKAFPMGGLFSRLACAGLVIAFYFSKSVLPVNLLPAYPRWVVDPPTLLQFLPWPILLAVIFWLWTKRESWGRHALLGLGFFLINLLPFLDFIPANYMRGTWVMDHFLYLPIIGLIGLAVAAADQLNKRLPVTGRPWLWSGLAIVMAMLTMGSHQYAKKWRDLKTICTYTLQHNPNAFVMTQILGNTLWQQGQVAAAIEQFQTTLRIKPDDVGSLNNLGIALLLQGHTNTAIEQFQEALRIDPRDESSHYNLGNALLQAGQFSKAIEQFETALSIKPDYVDAHNNLGVALLQTGRIEEAIDQYKTAIRIDPDYAPAHNDLGFILLQAGQVPEAMEECEAALKIKPDYAEAHYNVGNALSLENRFSEAIEQYEAALRIKPDYAQAQANLARAQALQKTAPVNH